MAGSHIKGAMPPAPGPSMEIVRVKTSETETFTLVSAAIWGQNVHWFSGRSHECTADKGNCPRCNSLQPVKWKGYIQAIQWTTRKECFLELTPNAYQQLDALTSGRKNFRGSIVRIRKSKGGAKGRYLIDILERTMPETELPAERDPMPILKLLWRCNERSGPTAA